MDDLEKRLARIEHKIGIVGGGVAAIAGGGIYWFVIRTVPQTWGVSEGVAVGIAFVIITIIGRYVERKFNGE